MACALPLDPRSASAARSRAFKERVSGWPELVAQWHPTRNGTLRPEQVSRGSGRKVWWRCGLGPDHEWTATPNNRIAGRTGCPFCAGRKVSVTNSLAALRPELARQWHPTRNGRLTAGRIVARSTRRVWWRCPAAPDHEWRVSPHDRANAAGGCPFCAGRRPRFPHPAAKPKPRPELREPRPTSATGCLREHHRRIEQMLALLTGVAGADGDLLARVLADVSSHLHAEETLLYPVVERAWGRPLDELRALHTRMHGLLSTLAAPANAASLRRHLADLETAFLQHSRRLEGAALPWIETAVPPASLEALRLRLQELRASSRGPQRCS